MLKEKDLIQLLNLLRISKNFVLHEIGSQGETEVLPLKKIPASNGIYWISGITKFRNGRNIESVFRVNTDTGGTLLAVYWWIDNQWYNQQDLDVFSTLKINKDDIFPYDWEYNVELKEDIYHN